MTRARLVLLATTLALASAACRDKNKPPPCDTTGCCELYQQEVFESCTDEEDEVHGCGKKAKRAYAACVAQFR